VRNGKTSPEPDSAVDYRLDRHDRTQLELKLSYGIQTEQKRQRYQVALFVFVPRVLALNAQTYRRDRFYQDTVTFIRMTTPKVPLCDLSQKDAIEPWAAPVRAAINAFADNKGGDINAAIRGIKLLACVLKSAVRDESIALSDRLNRAFEADQGGQKQVLEWVLTFGDDLRGALRRLRKVGEQSNQAGVPLLVRESWRAADEYTSLLCEEALTEIISLCDPQTGTEALHSAVDGLKTLAINEYLHRCDSGYQSYAVDGDRNEYLPHRWRVLKRYVSSALYLDVSRQDAGIIIADIIGMVAAATAMLFATVVALMATSIWGATLSLAFIGAMVLSYVIKDRIKEIAKRQLGRRARGILPDHELKIRAEDVDKPLGRCQEIFFVQEPHQLEADLLALRYCDLASHEAIEGRPETVLCYQKSVQLSSAGLSEHLAGATGLTDVVRLNISPMLERMDDNWELYRYVHPHTRELCEARCARVYHINLLLRLTAENEEPSLQRVRVVVNKKGIVRVEDVQAHDTIGWEPGEDLPPDGDTDSVAIHIADD
jgi:uncharacterized membrane protein YeaQ/YmgE (transglycosylase-associated protein family)